MKLDYMIAKYAELMQDAYLRDFVQGYHASPESAAQKLRNRTEALLGALANNSGVKEHAARLGSLLATITLLAEEPENKQLDIPGTQPPGDEVDTEALDEEQRRAEIAEDGESTVGEERAPRKPKHGGPKS